MSLGISNVALCAVMVAVLAGCGGGGGGGGGVSAEAGDTASPEEKPRNLATATTPTAASGTWSSVASGTSSAGAPTLADCEMFPSNAIFNTRIDDTSRFPAHARSWEWIGQIGNWIPFTANWGWTDNPGDVAFYGMPINIVDGSPATTDWPSLSFNFGLSGVNTNLGYPDKSDCAVSNGGGFGITRNCANVQPSQARFPFPLDGKVLSEHGTTCDDPNSCGDHHVLVVEKGACRLWESYHSYKIAGQWYSMATAAWDLKSNALRPSGWASADAAGLPITPLLAKASEAQAGEIKHALRVTFRNAAMSTTNYSWPARYSIGAAGSGGVPFGSLLRLRADFVIPDNWTPEAKAVATAAKRYGLYVADNGPDFYIQGEPSSRWTLQTYNELRAITLANMEFVDLGAITSDARFSADSMAASW